MIDVASMLTTAGFRCSAMSAKLTSAGAPLRRATVAVPPAGRFVRDAAGAGVREPATMRPTRKEPAATSTTVTKAKRRLM